MLKSVWWRAAVVLLPAVVRAQGGGMADDSAMAGMHKAMATHMEDGPHMRMTPLAQSKPGDGARAAAVAASLKTALAQYADYHTALAEGFTIFASRLPQRIYHFTRSRGAFVRTFTFDPAQPTSLLYEKTGDSTFRLVGAMYTAPHAATLADLDARIPLSVAQWHEHINLCVPPDPRGVGEWIRRDASGHPLFGLRGSIATEADCSAAGGRFIPHFFGWMVHVYPFETDTAAVWGRGSMEHM